MSTNPYFPDLNLNLAEQANPVSRANPFGMFDDSQWTVATGRASASATNTNSHAMQPESAASPFDFGVTGGGGGLVVSGQSSLMRYLPWMLGALLLMKAVKKGAR